MLTVDHVRCRISKEGVLTLTGQSGKARPRQIQLATEMLDIMEGSRGKSRDAISSALDQIETGPMELKLFQGLKKVVFDRCEFEASTEVNPEELRNMVWTLAAEQWRTLSPDSVFDRNQVLEIAAKHFECPLEDVETSLFGDLKNQHRLVKFSSFSPDDLVSHYHGAQVQAVFLKAYEMTIQLDPSSPRSLRRFLRALKFRGLLFEVERLGQSVIKISLSGPLSLFRQTSRYGLKLATLIPRLPEFGTGTVSASLIWGKYRRKIQFEHSFKYEAKRDTTSTDGLDLLERLTSSWQTECGWTLEPITGELVKALARPLWCLICDAYTETRGLWFMLNYLVLVPRCRLASSGCCGVTR